MCRSAPYKAAALPTLRSKCLLLNNDGLFQAYEYDYKNTQSDDHLARSTAPDDRFLCQLRDYFLSEKLETTLSLILNSHGPALVEHLLPDRHGTVSVPQENISIEGQLSAIVTGWIFEELESSVTARPKYRCVVDHSGLHRRIADG